MGLFLILHLFAVAFAFVAIEVAFAEAEAFRCDSQKLIVFDEVDTLLEACLLYTSRCV